MKTYNNLWQQLVTFQNLTDAYEKAKKRKSENPAVKEFSEHWGHHLSILLYELRTKKYRPQPLVKFILRDPKTRTICKSQFRDRIVHHALVNVLQPIFEPRFIHDSYASRKRKGTLPAIKRLAQFERKVTHNGTLVSRAQNANQVIGYALKCDIKHYFETVDHDVLISIIRKRIKDKNILWLVRIVLEHYKSGTSDKGMPLGNWTSQFFANIYLNELDQYVKHHLKAKHYIRYVDDFIILQEKQCVLEDHLASIRGFLKGIHLELHPNKCKIIPLSRGVTFLGFRHFHHYRLVRQRNIRKIRNKLARLLREYEEGETDHTVIFEVLQGWNAYAMQANTHRLRQRLEETTVDELVRRTLIRKQRHQDHAVFS